MPNPSLAENLLKKGEGLLLMQRPREAAALAHSFFAGDSRAFHLAGLAAAMEDDLEKAVEWLTRAVDLEPDHPTWLADLATVLFAKGQMEGAEEQSLRALALDTNCAVAHDILAEIAARQGHDYRAYEHIRSLAALRPNDPKTRARLAHAEYAVGNVPEAMRLMRVLISEGKATRYLQSEYVSALLYDPNQTLESLRLGFEEWADLCKTRTPSPVASRRMHGDRKLRLGYLAGEFAATPSRHFLLPIFRHHDRERFEITLYHTRSHEDAQSELYRELVDHWCNCSALSDQVLANRIEADEIDILVDLSGHMRSHRLGAFALRPAPVQVAYPNYPASTGLASIQHILTDRWVCPAGNESQYTEKVHRLSRGYLAYEPPPDAPAVPELPCDQKNPLVFGLFQRPAKLNAGVWDVVAGILTACPDSKLLVHYSTAELDQPGSLACGRVECELTARDIAPERIIYHGMLPLAQHLELVGQADIALDTFPYNGQTTTCECLWMGVPVVTLAGDTHSSRVGYELLDRAGLGDLIAATTGEYVQIAVGLARNRNRLRELRQGLRGRLRQSTILDHRPLVREIEAAYLVMWEQYLEENK